MASTGQFFHIDIREITRLADGLGRESGRIVRNELTTAMDRSNVHVKDAAIARHNRKSGGYAGAFKLQTKVSASGVLGLIDNIVRSKKGGFPYAVSLEFGRKAFSAVKAKALRFEIGGVTIFAKSVKAAPAQHLLEYGLRDATPRIEGEFAAARDRIAAKLERV
jgi:hypothetical protein